MGTKPLDPLAEKVYLSERRVCVGVPESVAEIVQAIVEGTVPEPSVYTSEAAFGVRSHWLDIRRNDFATLSPPEFKLFVLTDNRSVLHFSTWLKIVREAISTVVQLGTPRIKICISPETLWREDGIVLYLSAEQLPLLIGNLFGRLASSYSARVCDLPHFAAPALRHTEIVPLAYTATEGPVADWMPTDRIYSSRERRSMALQRTLGKLNRQLPSEFDVCYEDEEIRDGMQQHGFAGDRFHLNLESVDPVLERPMEIWEGFFQALSKCHEAREPAKIAVLEQATGITFEQAILNLTQAVSDLSEIGSQRKFGLTLKHGVRALFRPSQNRIGTRIPQIILDAGIETIVSPFWLQRLPTEHRNLEGFRELYEKEIGSPQREVAVSRLAALLGSRLVPTVRMLTWQGEHGSIQLFTELAEPSAPPQQWNMQEFERDLSEANILDFLCACSDRFENMEVSRDGHLILLDNTQTFGALGKYYRARELNGHIWRKKLIERLKALRQEQLVTELGDLLTHAELDALWGRVRKAVSYCDEVAAEIFEHAAFV
jgi:hypothetical protein